jgi:hypothetical protein
VSAMSRHASDGWSQCRRYLTTHFWGAARNEIILKNWVPIRIGASDW